MDSQANARTHRMPDAAPLTEPLAWHLATARMKELPRPAGRPSREAGDANTREERLILAALEKLIPEIFTEQRQVFSLMDPLVRTKKLTRKWLLDQLSKYIPEDQIVYPDRLREWHRDNLLLYDEQDRLESQSTAALLVMRRLDHRRKGWLPRGLIAPRSYFCWRQNASHLVPFPYELSLVPVSPQTPSLVKPSPAGEESPYLLWSPWKGASWDDAEAWHVRDHGAIRWVGEPTLDQLAQWLSPHEMASLAVSDTERLARQALRVLADRLMHSPSSGDPS